jgi:tRNA(fMet)-specific endonuclease VapC
VLILDTDHLSILAKDDPTASALRGRLARTSEDVGTTAVSVEEILRGWLAKIAAQKVVSRQVRWYAKFQMSVEVLGQSRILPFDTHAAEQFDALRNLRLGIGTMDMKIAAIVLACGAKLLSRNLRDFRRVPGLDVDDWL